MRRAPQWKPKGTVRSIFLAWQGRDKRLLFAAGNDAVAVEACRRPGGARRGGEAGADVKTLLEKAGKNLVLHGALAAEEMRAAGDVEEQPVLAVNRHQRRIAVAPVGKPFEQAAVSFRVGLHHIDRRVHGARIGNAHAALQFERLSPLVEGCDALGVAVAMADHQGQVMRWPGTPGPPQTLAQDPLRAEVREP